VNDAAGVIRPGNPTDLLAVERIERASFDDPWARTALLQELVPSSLRLPLVLELEGEVVGYLMAWRSADELHILNLAVAPERRRQGLAARLLEAALALARRGGLGAVTLEVRPGNAAARRLYRSFGFAEAGCRPNYYADTGEDALILTLNLDGS
jgi:ribosomal-protein-alanine N-acetyltransferase